MHFLIDITDLRSSLCNKYARVLRALLIESESIAGLPVEIADAGSPIAAAQVPEEHERLVGSNWWHAIPRARSLRLGLWSPALKLLAFYFCAKFISGTFPRKLKDGLAWNLAYSFEMFSQLWRERLGRLLEVDSDARRRALFHFWLGERGFTADNYFPACDGHAAARGISINNGDVLVLAGASWRHDIVALEKSKKVSGFRLVCLIYDLLPLDYPSLVTVQQRKQYKKFLCDIGRAADLIVTPNAFTAFRLESFFEEESIRPFRIEPISISGATLGKRGAGETTQRLRDLRLPEKKFMLCVSALRERKHVLWLYGLCAKLRQEQPDFPMLVIAGQVIHAGILGILADDPAWGKAGIFIEGPLDTELSWLYQNAQLCLHPSFEGGVGMAVMEAIQYGQSCIAADAPSLMEASGGFAEHLPRDETAWANAISRMLKIKDDLPKPMLSHRCGSSSFEILPQIQALLENDSAVLSKKAERPIAL